MEARRLTSGLLLLALAAGCRGGPSDAEAERLVRRYDELVAEAYRVGDHRVAEPVVGPAELRRLVGHIGARSDQGLTLDAQLLELTVRGVERPGQEILVETGERWRYRPRRIGSGEPAGPESTDRYRLRYHLTPLDRRWVVSLVEFTEKPEVGQPVPEPGLDVRTMHGLPPQDPPGKAAPPRPPAPRAAGGP